MYIPIYTNFPSELFEAIDKNSLEIVKYILKQEANIDSKNNDGETPLYVASKKGYLDIVKCLMENIVNIESKDNDGRTPLHIASINGHLEIVKYLLEKEVFLTSYPSYPRYFNTAKYIVKQGANIESKNYDGETPLYTASKFRHFDIVKCLIEQGANIESKNDDGRTPLEIASKNGHLEIVEYLVENGANIESKNKYGKTPFFIASENGNLDIVKYLLEQKANIESKDNNGWTPIYIASKKGFLNIVKYLVKHGANTESIDNYGSTPLGIFKQNGLFFVGKYLKKKMNNNKKNNNFYYTSTKVKDNTKLFEAIDSNNLERVKYLVEKGVNIEGKNKYGETPLFAATRNDHLDIVKYLVEQEANIDSKNNNGDTPLNSASYYGYLDIVKYLVEYGADIENKNRFGKTSLTIAKEEGHFVIVKYFNKEIFDRKERERLERERLEKEGLERERLERERLERERLERERLERERLERERLERERLERERLERERLERERLEKERLERERLERERLEKERLERERLERERLERERLERERLEKERLERERLKRERLERERLERERLKRERLERERLEKERLERERLERERLNNKLPKIPTLVIAINSFYGERYDHLDIKKDEFLIITDWNCGEKGWVYGHRKDNEEEKGIFPELFIKIYENENENDENKRKKAFNNEITPEYKFRFEHKINQLRSLKEMKLIDSFTYIEIDRNNLFNDAYIGIMRKSPQELKKILKIKYKGEEGLDAGGLLRDFFYQMSKIIGDPNYSLFKYTHNDSYELEINPKFSEVEPNYLEYYRFIGRIIGLSILNKEYLSISFILLLYKRLLNKTLEFSDLEYIDSELFKNLKYLKDNNGAQYLYLTFSIDIEDCFGNKRTIDLKPNGANINVTDTNKNEYIDLVVKNKLFNSNDKEQLEALKKGLYEIIPNNINSLIDEIDLKYLISGLNMIDVDDWENNTDYEGYEKTDITIINFWKCVRKFSNDNRIKLLIFATGNSQVPVTGFKDLQGSGKIQHFKLKKMGTINDLPKSHTCFNRIDLPPYTSLTITKQRLLLAISEGVGAFSME